jgi:hypothetical protein
MHKVLLPRGGGGGVGWGVNAISRGTTNVRVQYKGALAGFPPRQGLAGLISLLPTAGREATAHGFNHSLHG